MGLIVPWNFPVFLAVSQIATAFAAGNRAMVKMSENSRNLTRLLQELSPKYLPEDKLFFIEETGGVGIEFSKLAFDLYLYEVGRALDRGEDSRKDAAAVILYTAEAATKAALDAIQVLGGNGYTMDYPTGRFLRDAKLYEIGAGTSEVRRMLIGREIFQETA